MSVLHPVGPEPQQTYWVRRAIVIGAAILALILLIAVIVSQNSSGSVVAEPTTTAPAPSASISGPPPFTPTPTPVPAATPTPSESAKPTASAEPTESAQAKAKTTESAKPSESAQPKESTKAKESAKPKAKESAKAKPKTPAKPAAPVACDADDLKPTIDSDNQLKRKEAVTFSLSLVNESSATCTLKIDKDNFELKVYSGKDRIWSSNDCSTAVKPVTKNLAKGQAVAWKMSWNGLRSKDDCKNRPEIPRAGTYFATAQYDGARPVQRRMIIHS